MRTKYATRVRAGLLGEPARLALIEKQREARRRRSARRREAGLTSYGKPFVSALSMKQSDGNRQHRVHPASCPCYDCLWGGKQERTPRVYATSEKWSLCS